MSQASAHNVNRLLTGLILATLLAVIQPALESLRNFVSDSRAVLVLNSPFRTASHYYHPGDQVDFVVARTANFDAAFTGTRILERVYPGTHMSERIEGEPISGGIQLSPAHSKNPYDLEPLQYKAHPTLPETVTIDRKVVPLPPGIYRWRYPTTYTIYNHVHNHSSRTENFRVLPADVPIGEVMPDDPELRESERQAFSE